MSQMELSVLTQSQGDEERPSKRQRTTARSNLMDGISEAGQGLQLAIPRSVPYAYNDKFTVKQRYVDSQFFQLSGASNSAWIFRMSGWDPDVTYTGHQPFQRDLWASMYDYYSVLQCDYTIHVVSRTQQSYTYTAVGSNNQALGTLWASFGMSTTQSDLSLGFTQALERKGAQNKLIPPIYREITDPNTGVGTATFKGTMTPGDFIVDAVDSDADSVWTAVGSNPSINRYFGINVISPFGNPVGVSPTPTYGFEIHVELEYTIQYAQINQTIRQAAS